MLLKDVALNELADEALEKKIQARRPTLFMAFDHSAIANPRLQLLQRGHYFLALSCHPRPSQRRCRERYHLPAPAVFPDPGHYVLHIDLRIADFDNAGNL